MKRNVGSYDAAVRFIVGCGLLATVNHGYGWWGLIGLVPIATAAVGFCPLYWLLRLDTTACDEVEEGSEKPQEPAARRRRFWTHTQA